MIHLGCSLPLMNTGGKSAGDVSSPCEILGIGEFLWLEYVPVELYCPVHPFFFFSSIWGGFLDFRNSAKPQVPCSREQLYTWSQNINWKDDTCRSKLITVIRSLEWGNRASKSAVHLSNVLSIPLGSNHYENTPNSLVGEEGPGM